MPRFPITDRPVLAGDERLREKFHAFARTRDAELRSELTEAYLPLAAALAT